MYNQLRSIAVFTKVAEAGSFRGAAKILGLSASVVSQHVSALERHLDTPLIYRTTRKLSLTDAGRRLAASGQMMLEVAQAGFGDIGRDNANPTGRLKITAPAILQYARFVKRVATFVKHFPKVEIEMTFSDRQLNIVEQGFDIAFRVGELADSSLMSKKLAEGRLVLCASEQYLGAQAKIRDPGQLESLEMVVLSSVGARVQLTPVKGGGRSKTIRIGHRITVDSGFAARRMAIEHCGLVLLPDFFVQHSLGTGQLVKALPNWDAAPYGIYAVWPPNAGTNHLRNAFLKYVGSIAKTPLQHDTEFMD